MLPDEYVVGCVAEGRAVLLLGQRHTPGLVDVLADDVAALGSVDRLGSFTAQMQTLASTSALEPVRRAFMRHDPGPDMQLVADCPWSLVLLSAVDPVPSLAFARPLSSRRVRQIYATRRMPPITSSRNPSSLTVVRL